MTADELYEGGIAAMQEFARACAFGGDDDRATKGARLGSFLMALRDAALRTASAEPSPEANSKQALQAASPEVNVEARGLQAIGWQFRFKFPTHTSNWKSVLELPMSEIKAGDGFKYETRYVYARTAQADARREPLTDAQRRKMRDDTFSTSNPFCPCDQKTFDKVTRAVERAHGITTKGADHAE